jgi:protein farnesyltransferase subunit beta
MENKKIKEEKENKNKNRTQKDQEKVEKYIREIYSFEKFSIKDSESYDREIEFDLEGHLNFAKNMIHQVPRGYGGIDSGLPWFSYWVLNIIDLCSKNRTEISHNNKLKFVEYLKDLQHKDGGFCGYSKGHSHTVSNYAAVMAIVSLGIEEAYQIIDIPKMKNFLLRMKNNNQNSTSAVKDSCNYFCIEKGENRCSEFQANYPGMFQMHENGESDLRATYCALAVASILNILDDKEITQYIVENIKQCQTFEGGFGPEPLCEAHGGYSYCAIASLTLLNKLHEINVERFLLWLVNRQMTAEGGFNGRTNKLVDSCYSFWQGSVFNMLLMNGNELKYSYETELLYDQLALQSYILFCCQYSSGGLIDKPGKKPDLFHTSYAGSGLSLSQKSTIKGDNTVDNYKVAISTSDTLDLEDIHPIYCVSSHKVERALNYFKNLTNK